MLRSNARCISINTLSLQKCVQCNFPLTFFPLRPTEPLAIAIVGTIRGTRCFRWLWFSCVVISTMPYQKISSSIIKTIIFFFYLEKCCVVWRFVHKTYSCVQTCVFCKDSAGSYFWKEQPLAGSGIKIFQVRCRRKWFQLTFNDDHRCLCLSFLWWYQVW